MPSYFYRAKKLLKSFKAFQLSLLRLENTLKDYSNRLVKNFVFMCLVSIIVYVTGKSSTAKSKPDSVAKTSGGTSGNLDVAHIDSMMQKFKSDLNLRIKNIGKCKDGTHFDSIENKTNKNIDVSKIHETLTKGIKETPLKITLNGTCILRVSMTYSETRTSATKLATYYLSANITNAAQEVVWAHKQDLKIKL